MGAFAGMISVADRRFEHTRGVSRAVSARNPATHVLGARFILMFCAAKQPGSNVAMTN